MATGENTTPAYMTNIGQMPAIFQAAIAVMTEKARTYGESWKARGGRGAWYTLVRPMDRLCKIVEDDHQGDIFAAIAAAPEGGDGTVLDTVRDLRNYLTLVEAEMVSRGVVSVPSAHATSSVSSELTAHSVAGFLARRFFEEHDIPHRDKISVDRLVFEDLSPSSCQIRIKLRISP